MKSLKELLNNREEQPDINAFGKRIELDRHNAVFVPGHIVDYEEPAAETVVEFDHNILTRQMWGLTRNTKIKRDKDVIHKAVNSPEKRTTDVVNR